MLILCRGTHFYIALYWAEEMAKHDSQFTDLAKQLMDNEKIIAEDLIKCQVNRVLCRRRRVLVHKTFH